MISKVLYDSRNNEIKRVQPQPKGSAPMPSFKGLCKSARIPESDKEYMETLTINEDMLTKYAKRNYRIVNGDFILKPKVEITADKYEQSLSNDDDVKITVNIVDTLENETFNSVDLYVENANITVDLTENTGNKTFTFTHTGIYEVGCMADTFRSDPIEIEVVE